MRKRAATAQRGNDLPQAGEQVSKPWYRGVLLLPAIGAVATRIRPRVRVSTEFPIAAPLKRSAHKPGDLLKADDRQFLSAAVNPVDRSTARPKEAPLCPTELRYHVHIPSLWVRGEAGDDHVLLATLLWYAARRPPSSPNGSSAPA